MNPTRKLSLHREELGELSPEVLRQVAAAYAVFTLGRCLSTYTNECHGQTTCAIRDIVLSYDGCK